MFKDAPALAAVPLLVVIGLLALPVVLWVCAVPIARLVTQRLPSELAFGTISLVDCYSLAFIGVGLFYVVGHFAQVLTWTHFLFKQAIARPGTTLAEQVNPYEIVQMFVPFVVGLLLLVKARLWASALAARHTAGAATADSAHVAVMGEDGAGNRPTDPSDS